MKTPPEVAFARQVVDKMAPPPQVIQVEDIKSPPAPPNLNFNGTYEKFQDGDSERLVYKKEEDGEMLWLFQDTNKSKWYIGNTGAMIARG